MTTLTQTDHSRLRRYGIEVVESALQSPVAICRVRGQRRVYAIADLHTLANRRPLRERLWSWLSGRVAA